MANKKAQYVVSDDQTMIARNGEVIAEIVDGEWVFPDHAKRYIGPAKKIIKDLGKTEEQIKEEKKPKQVRSKYDGSIEEMYPDFPGKIDMMAGDKTPEFVWWLHRFYPAEAEERYRGRLIPAIPAGPYKQIKPEPKEE